MQLLERILRWALLFYQLFLFQSKVVVQVKGEKLDYNIEGGEGVLDDNYDTDIGEKEEGYVSGNYFYESVIVYYEEAIDENPSEEVGIRVEQGDKDYDDKEDEEDNDEDRIGII
ncbi:MAG: hypothetical protein EZS28_023469 [Streblomastix strix]|uniref:Uncharacterized protein n=1 Tax=Streblomastix strix TaxID=222440 RepID=A0A5J4VEW7_9EUKA|nr:MAG: hypothetical protein EZS28_023469 [Streblomastix strix]